MGQHGDFNPFKGLRLTFESQLKPGLSLLENHRLNVAYTYLSECESYSESDSPATEAVTRPASAEETANIQREVAHLSSMLDGGIDAEGHDVRFDQELRLSLERASDLSTVLNDETFRTAAGYLRFALHDEIVFQLNEGDEETVRQTIAAGIFLFMRFGEYLSARYWP